MERYNKRVQQICSHLISETNLDKNLSTSNCSSSKTPTLKNNSLPTLPYTQGKLLKDQVAIITGAGQGIGEGK